MLLEKTKGLTTYDKWSVSRSISRSARICGRASLGKKQSVEFGIKCYEAGIRDAKGAFSALSPSNWKF